MELPQNQSVRNRLAELLDSEFGIPGTRIRFGIDPLIGLLPGIGDWVGGVLALYFPVQAALMGAGRQVIYRMFVHILADILVGTIPLAGEIFDIAWKANLRNARLLDELEERPQELAGESRLILWTLLVGFVLVIFGVLWLIGWLMAQLIAALL